MKYLLVIAVVLVAFYIWRYNRESEARERAEDAARRAAPPPKPPAVLAAMTTCRHCGLHLPASEAIRGTLGDYCGKAHRSLGEG